MLTRLLLVLLPLALTPLWGFLLAEGYLDLGGGEKDVLLLIPWLLWSLLYAGIFAVGWVRHQPPAATLKRAVGGASALLLLVWLGLFVWSVIGTGGF